MFQTILSNFDFLSVINQAQIQIQILASVSAFVHRS